MSGKKYRIAWLLLLTLALIIRVGVGLYWNNNVAQRSEAAPTAGGNVDGPFFYGDSDSYWKLARAVAFRRPYEFDEVRRWQIFRTPGYPALLAPLFWIYGENPPTIAARLEGAVFGMLNVALVGWLAIVIFGNTKRGRFVALLAGIAVAIDPTEALQSVSILSEEPFMTFSILLNIGLVQSARYFGLLSSNNGNLDEDARQPENGGCESPLYVAAHNVLTMKKTLAFAAVMAFTLACALYLRPSWYYFLPFSCLVLFFGRFLNDFLRGRLRTNALWTAKTLFSLIYCALATLLLTQAFLAPWTLRNLKLTGKPIPTSLQMGASLYDGLSPMATGASDMTFVDWFREEELASPSAPEDVHFEVRLDKRMKDASIAWIKKHPQEVLRLACVKFYRLWAPVPREQAFNKPLLKAALLVSYLPVMILGLIGLIRALRKDHAVWILAIPALYITALHVVFVSSIRYRVPVMYGFAILGAYWLSEAGPSLLKMRNVVDKSDNLTIKE